MREAEPSEAARLPRAHRFLPFAACERALAAADLEAVLVRPSRSTLEAALAALDDVVFFGAPVWESALPAVVLDFPPVELLRNVADALDAAFAPVVLPLAMATSRVEVVKERGALAGARRGGHRGATASCDRLTIR